jgi:hypothetical protein
MPDVDSPECAGMHAAEMDCRQNSRRQGSKATCLKPVISKNQF